MYYLWGWTSIYRSLSYPFRSLDNTTHRRPRGGGNGVITPPPQIKKLGRPWYHPLLSIQQPEILIASLNCFHNYIGWTFLTTKIWFMDSPGFCSLSREAPGFVYVCGWQNIWRFPSKCLVERSSNPPFLLFWNTLISFFKL